MSEFAGRIIETWRNWPTWIKVLSLIVGLPLVPAVFVAHRWGRSTSGKIAAAALLVAGVLVYAGAGLSEPEATRDPSDEDVAGTTTPAEPEATEQTEVTATADPTAEATLTSPTVEPVDFDLVEVEDIGGNRINARVVLHGQPDPEQARVTALAVMAQLREESPYSGLSIFLYDRPEYTQGAFTLGMLEDAPGGDWESAFGAPSGNYDDHAQSIEIRDKDWAQQPSETEARLYEAWDLRLLELESDPEADFATTEDQAFEEVATAEGVTEQQVRDAVEAVITWQFQGETVVF